MKIGIDARSMLGERTGIGRYLETLLPRLAEIDCENEYILYFDRSLSKEEDPVPGPNFRTKVLDVPVANNYFTWLHFRLPYALAREKVDLFHFPFYTMPFRRPTYSAVVTMADISYQTHPEWYSLKSRIAMRPFSRLAARRADRIITTSQFSREEIAKHYGVPENRIRVIYLSPYKSFSLDRISGQGSIKKQYGLDEKYILYVGSIHTRRNTSRLLAAFSRLKKMGIGRQLVLVGRKEYPFQDLEKEIAAFNLQADVKWLNFVPEEDLVALYYGADMFVYPSLYEGFGLPVLEAMYCGVPVITSNVSALPEVAGDGALLIDPYSVDALTEAMVSLANDAPLRAQLVEKGKRQALRFSGKKMAEQTLATYMEAVRRA